MHEVRVGIVGAGGMGSEHARNLAALDGVAISVVADPVVDAATTVANAVGAEATGDGFAAIADARVDAVVIASPDDTHAALTIATIEAGKPVLCEKPLGDTGAEARAVLDAERANGERLLQLGLMREYDPAHRQLHLQLDDVGPIAHIRAVHRNRNGFTRSLDHAISQSLVHDVHTVRWLTGQEFESVLARHRLRPEGGARLITVSAQLSDGTVATLEFDDYSFGYEVAVEVSGEGMLVRTPPVDDPRLHDDWFAWFTDAYRAEAESWIESVRRGHAGGPSAADGLAAQLVVEAIQRSTRTGADEPVEKPLT